MSCYTVTYDINQGPYEGQRATGQKRAAIRTAIHDFDFQVMISESCYLIHTELTASQIFDYLGKHLDSNDTLYVMTLAPGWRGRGPQVVNKFLRESLG